MEAPETVVEDQQANIYAPIAAVCLDTKGTCTEYAVSPEGSFEVYSKCFIVQWGALHPTHQETVAAALMFNIGISFHMDFLRTGVMKNLQSASSFYRRAFQVMAPDEEIHESVGAAECKLILAICNNLGHCFAHLFEGKAASACQRQVRDLLASHFHRLQEGECGFEDDFQCFFSGLAVFSSDDVLTKISPAA